uniref:Uncharacterized protein n=1 Tax=Plectus sambesii TaxID=2011161 RepID=A0A914UN34_9BILA
MEGKASAPAEKIEEQKPTEDLRATVIFRSENDEDYEFSDAVEEAVVVVREGLRASGTLIIDGLIIDCSDFKEAPHAKCAEYPKKGSFSYIVIDDGSKEGVKYKLEAKNNENAKALRNNVLEVFAEHSKKVIMTEEAKEAIENAVHSLETEKNWPQKPVAPLEEKSSENEPAELEDVDAVPEPEEMNDDDTNRSDDQEEESKEEGEKNDEEDKEERELEDQKERSKEIVDETESATPPKRDPEPLVETSSNLWRSPEALDDLDTYLLSARDPQCQFCPLEPKKLTIFDEEKLRAAIESDKLVVVLFWLNVDAVSKHSFMLWATASTQIAELASDVVVGAVACHDYPAVCDNYVDSWPKLIAFKDGKKYQTYKVTRDHKLYTDWVVMLSQPPVFELKVNELKEFKKGKVAKFGNVIRGAATVGYFANKKNEEYKEFAKAAKKLHGRYHIGAIFGEKNLKEKNSFLVTYKPKEMIEKEKSYTEALESDLIVNFIEQSSRPTVIELNGYTMPTLHKRAKPYLVLIADTNCPEELLNSVHRLAIDESYNEKLSFVRITSDRSELTQFVFREYEIKQANLPALALVYHIKSLAYIFRRADEMGEEGLKEWIDSVLTGEIQYPLKLTRKYYALESLQYDHMSLVFGTKSVRPTEADKQASTGEAKGVEPPNAGGGCPYRHSPDSDSGKIREHKEEL